MSDSLDLALQEEGLQAGDKVREHARDMEQLAKQLASQQREMAQSLGIQP